MERTLLKTLSLVLVLSMLVAGGCSPRLDRGQQQTVMPQTSTFFNVDTVKAGQFDTGKMWTFDYPPTEYFNREYGFSPSTDWFEKARLGALRLPNCSASFVSEDGLVFTNHHCARAALDRVNRPGENLSEDGFYAPTLADERKTPGYFVDQLVLMEDVTDEVVKAFETGKTDEERVANRSAGIAAIEQRYQEKTGLRCNVITFYNGGKYSLYGYKRYNDVRLVFAPETRAAFFGGDYDNFTYPRYDLDVSFFRVYDDEGKPLKTPNYFRWSSNGAQEGEPVFVVGNPGRTSRLLTVAQLEFNRDYSYPYVLGRLTDMVSVYSMYLDHHPDMKLQYETQLFSFANSQKVYVGRIKGLHDQIIMAKKKDFERKFRNAVMANPRLAAEYGPVWKDIEATQSEKAKIYNKLQALTFSGIGRPSLFGRAMRILDVVSLSALPEAERAQRTQGMPLDTIKARILEEEINTDIETHVLAVHLQYMQSILGTTNSEFNKLLGGMSPGDAARSLMKTTVFLTKERVSELMNRSTAQLEQSNDPIMEFIARNMALSNELRQQYVQATSREQARVQILGKALFDVYGTSIPPDATFTLRIADGVVKNYNYNGTLAPMYTTFYGMYDRYYSFNKQAPWSLSEKWLNPPPSFDMSKRFNFVSTNDIIGGNSGSPVLNKNLEVVGIAFDGNIESLPGDFIFDDTLNRTVSVHSAGILEALEDIYKADRLAAELKAAKIK